MDYLVTIDLAVTGVGVDEVAATLREVLAEHEAMRTSVVLDGGYIWQAIGSDPPDVAVNEGQPPVPTDLGLRSGASLVRGQVWIDGPSVRVRICGEHTIVDGESMNLLARELARRLLGVREKSLIPSSYVAWAAAQRAFLASKKGGAALATWGDLLGPDGTFPDHPMWRPNEPSPSEENHDGLLHRTLSDFETVEVLARLRHEQITPTILATSLLAHALSPETSHVVIHTPVANRFGDGRETIGWLAHGLPIRVETRPDFGDQVLEVKRALLASLRIASVPLPLITRTHFPAQLGVAEGRRRPRLYVDCADRGRTWSSDRGSLSILPDPWPMNHGEPGLSFHLALIKPHPEFAIVVPPEQTSLAMVTQLDADIQRSFRSFLEREMHVSR